MDILDKDIWKIQVEAAVSLAELKIGDAKKKIEDKMKNALNIEERFWYAYALMTIECSREGKGFKVIKEIEEDLPKNRLGDFKNQLIKLNLETGEKEELEKEREEERANLREYIGDYRNFHKVMIPVVSGIIALILNFLTPKVVDLLERWNKGVLLGGLFSLFLSLLAFIFGWLPIYLPDEVKWKTNKKFRRVKLINRGGLITLFIGLSLTLIALLVALL